VKHSLAVNGEVFRPPEDGLTLRFKYLDLAPPLSFAVAVSPSSSTSAQSDHNSFGADKTNVIALGVGLGIGLPTVMVSVLASWYPRHRIAARG
jgi:hypothetical protein